MVGNRPPPHLFSVKGFPKHGSVGVCRRAAINPARSLCVAGYFRCIGVVPVHVIPATFLVAPVSVVLPLVCSNGVLAAFGGAAFCRCFWAA